MTRLSRRKNRVTSPWPEGKAGGRSSIRLHLAGDDRAKALAECLGGIPWEQFVSLTFDTKRVGSVDQRRANREASRWCENLPFWFRSPVGWLYVMERGTGGAWHVHVLLVGLKGRPIDGPLMTWNLRNGDTHVTAVSDALGVTRYVAKTVFTDGDFMISESLVRYRDIPAKDESQEVRAVPPHENSLNEGQSLGQQNDSDVHCLEEAPCSTRNEKNEVTELPPSRAGACAPLRQPSGTRSARTFKAPTRDQTADPYLGLKSLAGCSGLSVRTLRGHLKRRQARLPHYRVGGKILVLRSEFDSWMKRHFHQVQDPDHMAIAVNQLVDELCADVASTLTAAGRRRENRAPLSHPRRRG